MVACFIAINKEHSMRNYRGKEYKQTINLPLGQAVHGVPENKDYIF